MVSSAYGLAGAVVADSASMGRHFPLVHGTPAANRDIALSCGYIQSCQYHIIAVPADADVTDGQRPLCMLMD